MKILIAVISLVFVACGSSSNEAALLDSLQQEGYGFGKGDSISFDFFSSHTTPGELEQGLIEAGLIDIKTVVTEVFVELKYSSDDNFFGKDVYGELENCYLQPVVAEMLAEALNFLQSQQSDLTFKIFDGVRPLSVQQILWDELKKPDSIKPLYVAEDRKST